MMAPNDYFDGLIDTGGIVPAGEYGFSTEGDWPCSRRRHCRPFIIGEAHRGFAIASCFGKRI
jgi:hypothetical protein